MRYAIFVIISFILCSCDSSTSTTNNTTNDGTSFNGLYTGSVSGYMIGYTAQMTLNKKSGAVTMPGFDTVWGTITLVDSSTAPLYKETYPAMTGKVAGYYGYEAPYWGMKLYFWNDSLSMEQADSLGKKHLMKECIYDNTQLAFAGKCYNGSVVRMYKVK